MLPASVLSVLSLPMLTPSEALRTPLPNALPMPPSPRREMLPEPWVLSVLSPSQMPLRTSPATSASSPLTCPPTALPSLLPWPKKRMFPPLASITAPSSRMAAAALLALPACASARPCASALNSTFSAPLSEAIMAPPPSSWRISMLPAEFTRSVAVPPLSLITCAPLWKTTPTFSCGTVPDERVVSVTSAPWLNALPITLAAMLPVSPSPTIVRFWPPSAVQLPLPPPAPPPAWIFVPSSTLRLPAEVRISPPFTPAASPRASSVPPTSRPAAPSTLAPIASSTISPPRLTSDRARTVPLWLTTCCATPDAPTSTTRPPSAVMVPVFITSALVLALSSASSALPPGSACTTATEVFISPPSTGTVNFVSPSPSKSSVTRAPDTRPTEPRATLISPSLRTSAPISPTVPPSPTLIVAPGCTVTRAVLLASLMSPPRINCLPPAMKASLRVASSGPAMSSVEAISPPVLTLEPLEKTTPEGLIR